MLPSNHTLDLTHEYSLSVSSPMQKIERYGVLALILLVITLFAVGVWGDRPENIEDPVAQGPGVAVNRRVRPRVQPPTAAQIQVPPQVQDSSLPVDPALGMRSTPEATASEHFVPDVQSARLRRAVEIQEHARAQRPATHSLQDKAPEQVLVGDQRSKPGAIQRLPERVHVVRSGDVFSTIVERECGGGRFTGQVMACNPGLDPDRILVGQRIMLPARDGSLVSRVSAVTDTAAARKVLTVTEGSDKSKSSGRVRSLNVYRVQSGDVLSRIISTNCPAGVRLSDVVALNKGMDPNRILVGQELRLPRTAPRSASKSSQGSRPKRTPSAATPSGPTHRVRPGDILGRIATQQGCTLASIVAANPGLDPDRIRVGQVLQLPASSSGIRAQDSPGGAFKLARASGLSGRRWAGVK